MSRDYHYSWREDRQTTRGQRVWKQVSEECLGHRVKIICSSQSTSLRGNIHGYSSLGTKTLATTISLPIPQHKHRVTCRKQCNTDPGCLTCSQHVTHSSTPVKLPFLVKFASFPGQQALPIEGPHKCYTHIKFLQRLNFGGDGDDSFRKQIRVQLLKTHHIQARN